MQPVTHLEAAPVRAGYRMATSDVMSMQYIAGLRQVPENAPENRIADA
jgi:hypothetical protein